MQPALLIITELVGLWVVVGGLFLDHARGEEHFAILVEVVKGRQNRQSALQQKSFSVLRQHHSLIHFANLSIINN